jgi:hypothetical protein
MRASRAFPKAGVDFPPLPSSDVQKRFNNVPERSSIFRLLTTETAAIAGYGFRGWI